MKSTTYGVRGGGRNGRCQIGVNLGGGFSEIGFGNTIIPLMHLPRFVSQDAHSRNGVHTRSPHVSRRTVSQIVKSEIPNSRVL